MVLLVAVGDLLVAHGDDPGRTVFYQIGLHGEGAEHIDDHRNAPGLPGALNQMENLNVHMHTSVSIKI